ncbi:hypothetical protein Dsin_003294 [Dipteronia sinensis]|uniref:Uncharacterized protein n=1 Tax=Dipteronia sinensis TaxID=43782 RepID=A0AAE0EK34_9ROSI|nr:hypothetical protein Dsin_003294 [Dipteronia sinensis]
MAFSAILRKSASSLALTASQHARANRNYFSAVFTASSHLDRKPTLGSFVPDFEFSSATETKNYSSNESLLQAIDLAIKHIDHHVEETPSEFTFKVNRDFNRGGRVKNVELRKEFQGELVEVVSSYIYVHQSFEEVYFSVYISKNGGSRLQLDCSYTPYEILISDIKVFELYSDHGGDEDLELDFDENLKKAFQKFLEVRGIKPSIVAFMFKCVNKAETQRKLKVLKKIKNFIE